MSLRECHSQQYFSHVETLPLSLYENFTQIEINMYNTKIEYKYNILYPAMGHRGMGLRHGKLRCEIILSHTFK